MTNIYSFYSYDVKKVLEILLSENYEAYVVGGAVRDALLRKKINDYDICTNALPEEVKRIFVSNGYKVVETGIKHGTVTVINNKVSFEITTFRTEKSYKDNRHPDEVIFSNDLNEDLVRRDFNMNAMAASISGDVIDNFNGIEDIKNKVIKTVGDPDLRFSEDALRMIRAIRFASKLNFIIDEEVKKAIIKNSDLIKNVSIERINKEMEVILSYNFSWLLKEYKELFIKAYDYEEKFIEKAIEKLDNFSEPLMKVAYLLSFYDENELNCKINSMKLSKENKNKIISLYHNTKDYDCDSLNEYELKSIYSKYGMEFGYDVIKYICYYNNIDLLMLNGRIEKIKEEVYTINTLEINGNDLLELGYYKEQIGKALNVLLDMVLSGKVKNEKNALMQALYKIDLDYMDYMN